MRCVVIWYVHFTKRNVSNFDSKICMNEGEGDAFARSLWERWDLWRSWRVADNRIPESTTIQYKRFLHKEQGSWVFKMEFSP